MEQQPGRVRPSSLKSTTSLARRRLSDYVERARKAEEDTDKQQRLEATLCKVCWYLRDGIGGAAITNRPCGLCLADQRFSSTDTNLLCSNCAQAHELCKCCGADLHLRQRRQKPWPESE